ncbi:hypothetical protein [Lunatimonas salinarum]|uniref:hypothetical protein n=1 Tax=Lunatimonas salinarum TaxID=1774590 RepID=UPI001FD82BB0|nr:hypothetical protein [Lunatimonas salinarum]
MMRLVRGIFVLTIVVLMGACTVFQPRVPYQLGMSESKFLRQNRNAVISQLGEGKKVYRLTSDDRFYLLVTFEEGVLTELQEKELLPLWQQQRMMEQNLSPQPHR